MLSGPKPCKICLAPKSSQVDSGQPGVCRAATRPIWREIPEQQGGCRMVMMARGVAKKGSGAQETADQQGGRRRAGSTLSNEEDAKHPERCHMVRRHLLHSRN